MKVGSLTNEVIKYLSFHISNLDTRVVLTLNSFTDKSRQTLDVLIGYQYNMQRIIMRFSYYICDVVQDRNKFIIDNKYFNYLNNNC